MIHRFHEQVFQRMPPERRARKLAVMKSLVKSIKNKSKENGNPLNNNMALSRSFTHSTPVKSQQITNLDDVESETEIETDLRQPELCGLEKRDDKETYWEEVEEPKLDISKIYDSTYNNERAGHNNISEGLENDFEEEGVTVLEVVDDEHWKSLEVLHETAEYEFCRSLEESKLFVSTSSLLEEIEADLPLRYSLAKPLNHTFHTLTSYRVQSRLARMDGNVTCPEMVKQSENLNASIPTRKIKKLEIEAVVQKALAEQSEKALILSKSQKMFGVQYIESEKALLLANLRCEAVVQEMKRLRTFGEVAEKAPDFGQVTISDICFEVNQSKDNWTEKYVCTVTERENVQSTSVVSEVKEKKLRFSDELKFSNLSRDFVIYIDLFKLLPKEPKKLLSTNLLRKLKKVTAVNLNRSLTGSSCSTGGFACIAQSELRLENIVNREDDKCILQNYLTVNLQRRTVGSSVNLLVKTDINLKSKKSGFLNVFKQTWHRKWFQQSGYYLESWLYPEDQESGKIPEDSLYLPKCRSVEPVGLEICIRPYSFVINLKEADEGIIFSANSHKDMLTWVDHLNLTLELIRLWNPKT